MTTINDKTHVGYKRLGKSGLKVSLMARISFSTRGACLQMTPPS